MSWDLKAMQHGNYIYLHNDEGLKNELKALAHAVFEMTGQCDLFLEDGGIHGDSAKRIWRHLTEIEQDSLVIKGIELEKCWLRIKNSDPSVWKTKNELSAYWALRGLIGLCVERNLEIEVNM